MSRSKLLSQRQYAALRGVSQQAVSKAVKSGRIPTTGGLIDPVVADAAWPQNTRPRTDLTGDPSRAAGAAEPESGQELAASERPHATYNAARALREVYAAKRAKLEFEVSEGKLVPVEEVRAQAYETARAMRDQLLSLPARLAPIVFAAKDVSECHRLLEEALRHVCAGTLPDATEFTASR